MAAWLDAIMSPLNAAGEGIQKLVEIRDTVKFGQAVTELYTKILAAQQGALAAQARESTLLKQIDDLEKHVSQLEAWNAEKGRYELVALAPNIVACAVKENMRGNEPPHYICANCYNDGKKSFLQQEVRGSHLDKYRCNTCGQESRIDKGTGTRSALRGSSGGPHSWMGS